MSRSPYRAPPPRTPDRRELGAKVIHMSLRWIRDFCADDAGVYLNVKHELSFIDGQTCERRVIASFPPDRAGAFVFLLADDAHLYSVRDAAGQAPGLWRIPKRGGEEALVTELPADSAVSSIYRLTLHGDHIYWKTLAKYEPDPANDKLVRRTAPGRCVRVARGGGAPEELRAFPDPILTVFSTGSRPPRYRPLRGERARLVWASDVTGRVMGARITGKSGWIWPKAAVELVEAPARGGPLAVHGSWEIPRDRMLAVDSDRDGVYAITRRTRWLRASEDELVWMPATGGPPEVLASWLTSRKRSPWVDLRVTPAAIYWSIDRQLRRMEKPLERPTY